MDLHPEDLMNLDEWLINEQLLSTSPSKEEKKKGLSWVKRHLKGIKIVTLRRGVHKVRKSQINKSYQAYKERLPDIARNKKRAALILNVKNRIVKLFAGSAGLQTKEEREAFFDSTVGKNAVAYFESFKLKENPTLLRAGETAKEFAPSKELKELLAKSDGKDKGREASISPTSEPVLSPFTLASTSLSKTPKPGKKSRKAPVIIAAAVGHVLIGGFQIPSDSRGKILPPVKKRGPQNTFAKAWKAAYEAQQATASEEEEGKNV